jgi:hypothetical protein
MNIRAGRGNAIAAAVAVAAMGCATYANAGCGDFKAAHTADSWLGGGAGPTLIPASFSLSSGHLELVNGRDEAPIVGMWRVKFIVGTDVIDDALATWHSDGTEIMNSSKPPISQSWCMGVWKQIGRSSYKLHHIAIGWTEEGAPLGPAEIRETVTVERSGNTFTGHFTIDQYMTDETAPPIAHVEGDLQGTRVTVD